MNELSKNARSNNFNLLRLIFASLVIVAHCPEIKDGNRSHEPLTMLFGTVSFGEFAVDSFFLLSGFLIVKSWIGKPSARVYLGHRIRRIFPGFLFASLVCAFVVGPIGGRPDYFATFDFTEFVRHVLLLKRPYTPPVFQGSFHPEVNDSMWTIFWEFSCYMLVLAFGMAGAFRWRPIWPAVAVALMVLVLVGSRGRIHLVDTLNIRLFMMFFFGGTFYLYGQRLPSGLRELAIAALLLCACMFSPRLAEPAIAIFWGYLVLSFAQRPAGALAGFNRLPDISYGVYLYAWPITKLLMLYHPTIGYLSLTVSVLALSLLAGTLSWYGVEKHFMATGHRRVAGFAV